MANQRLFFGGDGWDNTDQIAAINAPPTAPQFGVQAQPVAAPAPIPMPKTDPGNVFSIGSYSPPVVATPPAQTPATPEISAAPMAKPMPSWSGDMPSWSSPAPAPIAARPEVTLTGGGLLGSAGQQAPQPVGGAAFGGGNGAGMSSSPDYVKQPDGSYRLSGGRTYDPKSDVIKADNGSWYDRSSGWVTNAQGGKYKITPEEAASSYWGLPDLSAPTGGGLMNSGGSSGSGYSGAFGGSAAAPAYNPVLRPVDGATETIEGRIGNLLATDQYGNYTHPNVRQAAESAMAQFASRGLLNSSMSAQAAQEAAISRAIEIAGPDAQTYFSQGRANQDASNVFLRDQQSNAFDNQKLDKTMALDWARLSQDDKQFYANIDARLNELKLSNENQAAASELAHKYQTQLSNNRAVNDAYNTYINRLAQIDADTNLSAEEKVKQKNSAGVDFDRFATYYGVADTLNLGNRFNYTPSPSPAPGANSGSGSAGGNLPSGFQGIGQGG